MKTKSESLLKKLSKLELLELLAEQEREIQELKKQLEQKDLIIGQRVLCMKEFGNIAQAALALNGVFEAAQKAADQYVVSVKEMMDTNLRKEGMPLDEKCQADSHGHALPPIDSVCQKSAVTDVQAVMEEEAQPSFTLDEILEEVKALREKPDPNEQEYNI